MYAEAAAPEKYQGAINNGAHPPYSPDKDPKNQTGDQYKTYANGSGTDNTKNHLSFAFLI
jgi:hypothetical protein